MRLEFADPVHAVRLEGTGFLYAIREVLSPPGTKPDDVVTRSVVLNDVPFVDAGLPDAPLDLGTVNLQQPMLPGTTAPPASLGFALHWTPTAAARRDRAGAVAGRRRRRAAVRGARLSTSSAGASTRTATSSRSTTRTPARSRSARAAPPPTRRRSARAPTSSSRSRRTRRRRRPSPRSCRSTTCSSRPTAGSAGTARPAAGQPAPVPDLLARRARPALGDGARRVDRPAREAPAAAAAAGPAARPRRGRAGGRPRARAASARSRPPGRRPHAARREPATRVVLEWGWTQAERDRDPHATEFRVYWQPLAPDVVAGRRDRPADAHRPALRDVGHARPAARAGRDGRPLPLAARLSVQDRVAHRGAVDRPARSSAACSSRSARPRAADFEFRPPLDGSEQRPPAWAERTAVVPITAAESYRARLPRPPHARRAASAGPRLGRRQRRRRAGLRRRRAAAGRAQRRPARQRERDRDVRCDRALPRAAAVRRAAAAAGRARGRHRRARRRRRARARRPARAAARGARSRRAIASSSTGSRSTTSWAAMSADANGTIGATFPDGATASYTLANPTDQAALVEQIRSGDAGARREPLPHGLRRCASPASSSRSGWRRCPRLVALRRPHRHAAAEGRAVRAPHPHRRPGGPRLGGRRDRRRGSCASRRCARRRRRELDDGRRRRCAGCASRPACATRSTSRGSCCSSQVRGCDARRRRQRPRRRAAPAAPQRARSLPRRRAAPAPRRRHAARAVVRARRAQRDRRAARPHPGDDARSRPRPARRAVGRDDDARRHDRRATPGRSSRRPAPAPLVVPPLAVKRAGEHRRRALAGARPARARRARAQPRRRAQLRAGEPVAARQGSGSTRCPAAGGSVALPPGAARRPRAQRDRRRGGAELMAAPDAFAAPRRRRAAGAPPGDSCPSPPHRSRRLDATRAPVAVPATCATPSALAPARRCATPGARPASGCALARPAGDPLAGRHGRRGPGQPVRDARRVAQAIAFGRRRSTSCSTPAPRSRRSPPATSSPPGAPVATATGVTILCAGQDRIARDPALWSAQIAAAIASAGADAGTWPAFAAAVATQTASGPNPPVLVLDHTRRAAASTRTSRSAPARRPRWRGSTAADGGDLQRAVARLHALDPGADAVRARSSAPAARCGSARSRRRRPGAHPPRGRRGGVRARSRSRRRCATSPSPTSSAGSRRSTRTPACPRPSRRSPTTRAATA